MKLVSSKELLKTKIFRVTEDHAVDPEGFEIKRAIVQHDGSAVIMPVDGQGRIMLVRQYRLPARQYLWELPAGRLDAGETALIAAKRELQEETGIKAGKWTKLAEYYPSPGFLAEKMDLFAAEELEQGESKPMEDERIETRWFPPEELDQLIREGKLLDGKTLIGFLTWQRVQQARKTSGATPEHGD